MVAAQKKTGRMPDGHNEYPGRRRAGGSRASLTNMETLPVGNHGGSTLRKRGVHPVDARFLGINLQLPHARARVRPRMPRSNSPAPPASIAQVPGSGTAAVIAGRLAPAPRPSTAATCDELSSPL